MFSYGANLDQSCRSTRSCFQYLNPDTVLLHDERIITVQEEPSLHVEPHQRDVTNVKRSEWLNMESRNLVPGDLMKLTFRVFIPAVLTYSRSSKTARENVQEARLELGRALTLRFATCCRDVLCFVQGRRCGARWIFLVMCCTHVLAGMCRSDRVVECSLVSLQF